MSFFIRFLRQMTCFHDYGAPYVSPMLLAKCCVKCKHVRIGRPVLRKMVKVAVTPSVTVGKTA